MILSLFLYKSPEEQHNLFYCPKLTESENIFFFFCNASGTNVLQKIFCKVLF